MNVRTSIDPDCPYIPWTRGHSPICNPVRHAMLAMSVTACIEPPMLRALKDDHDFCALLPCAACRRPHGRAVRQ